MGPPRRTTPRPLKRVAIFQIRLPHFRSLFPHVLRAKPLHTFARHALATIKAWLPAKPFVCMACKWSRSSAG
ncbi:hypothetical protein GFL89_15270 [Rhizobium leguminosarum bv. viciae]|nr:hypothetical protein [Rhizobium leguminosarum bv. viciae]